MLAIMPLNDVFSPTRDNDDSAEVGGLVLEMMIFIQNVQNPRIVELSDCKTA
jgi:hypothetical protein